MIGDNIKRRIDELRMSVAKAAERCGIPVGTMYTYITDKREPTASRLKKIAEGLNTTIDDLLKEPKSPYPTTDELRGAPGADAMFVRDGFYDRMSEEDKEMLEAVLQNIKKRYGGRK